MVVMLRLPVRKPAQLGWALPVTFIGSRNCRAALAPSATTQSATSIHCLHFSFLDPWTCDTIIPPM